MDDKFSMPYDKDQVEITRYHTVYDLIRTIAQYPPETKVHCLFNGTEPIGIITLGDVGNVTDIFFASITQIEESYGI